MRQRRSFSMATESRRTEMDREGSSSPLPARASARCVSLLGVVGLAVLSVLTPACYSFDTERALPKRGTVGEEMYGVICDRVAAQAIREDLSGASFRAVCHKPFNGGYSDKVDVAQLPPIEAGLVDTEGRDSPVEKQRADRARAVGRVEALARRRPDIIRALDAAFPEERIPVKDLDNDDPTKSCTATKKGEGLLTDALADMLGRMGELYNDGTLPQSTESLSRVVDAFKKDGEAQKAWARISARNGYRPIDTGLGVLRPIVAYPGLRDFSNATLSLLSADSKPYEPNPDHYEDGTRIPVAGPANGKMNKMLEAAHEELLTAKADPRLPTLAQSVDLDGRVILSRPRDNLEMMQKVLFAEDDAFRNGQPNFIVRRDARGYAMIRDGAVPSPLVDTDGDGLPDLDLLGRFKTADGSIVPSPFSYANGPNIQRDQFDRAIAGGDLLYQYIDTSRTFAARMMVDVKPLANPDPAAKHGTIMDMMAALPIMMGPRETRVKEYPNGSKVEYDGIRLKDSPMLDLVYAMGAILGDRSADNVLAMANDLMAKERASLARLSGGLSAAFDASLKHPEAKLERTSTFWDETLDAMTQLVREPGLLEDMIDAMADPATAELGNIYARYANFRDMISYDPNNLNGPPINLTTRNGSEPVTPVDRNAPITGDNRSEMYRFLQLIADTDHVTSCNKAGAVVHAKLGPLEVTMPPIGSYKECEVFKIEEMAQFYLDVITEAWQYDPDKPNKRGTMYLRNDIIRNGILGIGAATQGLIEQSSGITGFVNSGDDRLLSPTPQWIDRLVFFDVLNDSPRQGDKNFRTNRFIRDLNGEQMGSAVCPERIIQDPNPSAPDARPDGQIRGLRTCQPGQWLRERAPATIFTWEHFGFYRAMKPVLSAFVRHKREDLFVALATASFRHYQNQDATESECRVTANTQCARDNIVSYEPLITEALATDVVPALTELSKTLTTMAVTTCTATGANGECTATQNSRAVDIVAQTARAMLDPDYSKAIGLHDRLGNVTAKRNDGKLNPQVTPAYLLTNALGAIDLAFDKYEEQHPEDKDRRTSWRRARSQLVDQFLGTTGIRSNSAFANPALPKMTPVLVEMLRSQLIAHCPRSFTPPYEPCTWAREELTKKASEVLGGPLVNSGIDVMAAIADDPGGRRQMNALIQYLVDAASENGALGNVLASVNDMVQLLRDDENLIPLMRVLAAGVDTTKYDARGRAVEKSLIDAQTALLARLSGKYFTKDGKEICANEIDPNQILTKVLGKLVTPIKDGTFKGDSPIEVLIDVIADVNRADPTEPYAGSLEQKDYGSVAQNVVEFLTDRERGLEQFYEVIRQGTR
jgi:hypothetical protein